MIDEFGCLQEHEMWTDTTSQKVTLPLKSSPNVRAQIVFHHSKNYVLRSVVDPDIVALHPNIVNNNRLNPIDINYRDIFKTAAWHNGQKATKS